MHKKIGLLIGLAIISLALTFVMSKDDSYFDLNDTLQTNGIINQNYVNQSNEKEILSIYYKDQLLGIIHDMDEYNQFLDRVYEEKYVNDFPGTEIGLGEDVHISTSISSLEVEDKDEEIFAYLEENNLFSVMGYKIEFSNGSIAYVKNSEDFMSARDDFVLNYFESNGVDPIKTKENLDKNEGTSFSKDERKDVSYKYLDTAEISYELVPINLTLKTYDECITWLSFGYDYEPKYYAVEEGDMIEGVAYKNSVSIMNLLSVNSEKLKSTSQLLQIGEELNVTPIDSPINVEVVKQKITVEPDYPSDTKYIYDDTMREGQRVVEQEYKVGSYRVQYNEVYLNGVLDESRTTEVSRKQIDYPQREIVRVGTKIIPNIGSGKFRFPTDNAQVTCGWYCYGGHRAIDIVNPYNRYGNVRAADRGTIVEVGNGPVTGYYVIINHNNGLWTYYGHMKRPCFYNVGYVVTKGEIIGQIGETGRAFGAHIHFEVRNGPYYHNTINPWAYME